MLTSTVIAAAGGGLFWLAAARTSTTADVGRATALFSSIAFVTYLTALGLPMMVARFGGARTPESGLLFNWAFAISIVSSSIVAVAYLPFLGHRADALFGSGVPLGTLFFALVAAGSAVCQLIDMRLTVQRQWRWVNIRIALYSLLRFPLLFLGLRQSVFLLFALAAGLPALSGFVAWWFAEGRVRRFRLRPVPARARRAARYSFVSYLSQLAVQAPVFVLPVLVLLAVPPKQNAAFFIAWSITVMVLLLPTSVVRVRLAEGTSGRDLARQTRISLVVNGGIGIAAAAAAVLGAGLVTTIYGQGYEQATALLPLLVVAVVPSGVVLVALTHARVIDDEPATLWLSAFYALAVLVPSLLLVSESGARGAAQGWFAGNCATAVVAALWLFHSLRKEEAGDTPQVRVAVSTAS